MRETLIRKATALGNGARDLRMWPAARAMYGLALSVDPSLAHIWAQYAHALKKTGRIGPSEDAYRRSLALLPDSADTHLQLGHLLFRKGRLAEAEAAYVTADGLDPKLEGVFGSLQRVRQAMRHAALARRSQDTPDEQRRYQIGNAFFGTMGLCNASCASCPTGKVLTHHVPRTPMRLTLFERIIREIALEGYRISGQISFGLFGDALLDPFVVERARLLRTYLPDAYLSINTNAAAYNPAKHRDLVRYASTIAVHVESLNPETYAKLMAPLRLNRVLPKVHAILQDFPGVVRVSAPSSKLNIDELPEMKRYFGELGACIVHGDPFSSRCADDRTVFEALAISPSKHWCTKIALDQLVVDCDGEVLLCCNDFERREPVGNLAHDSLSEVLGGPRRAQLEALFESEQLGSLKTCAACYVGHGGC